MPHPARRRGRPVKYPPIPEPGFAERAANGHEDCLAAIVEVLARRIDAGVATHDLTPLSRGLHRAAAELFAVRRGSLRPSRPVYTPNQGEHTHE